MLTQAAFAKLVLTYIRVSAASRSDVSLLLVLFLPSSVLQLHEVFPEHREHEALQNTGI